MNNTVQHVVAELAANAVTHGRVPGRDFELRLRLLPEDTLRIEVSDARGDRQLRSVPRREIDEAGRGLVIVSVLARTWARRFGCNSLLTADKLHVPAISCAAGGPSSQLGQSPRESCTQLRNTLQGSGDYQPGTASSRRRRGEPGKGSPRTSPDFPAFLRFRAESKPWRPGP